MMSRPANQSKNCAMDRVYTKRKIRTRADSQDGPACKAFAGDNYQLGNTRVGSHRPGAVSARSRAQKSEQMLSKQSRGTRLTSRFVCSQPRSLTTNRQKCDKRMRTPTLPQLILTRDGHAHFSAFFPRLSQVCCPNRPFHPTRGTPQGYFPLFASSTSLGCRCMFIAKAAWPIFGDELACLHGTPIFMRKINFTFFCLPLCDAYK